MELTLVLAKGISLLYLAIGFALLAKQIEAKELIDSFKQSPAIMLLTGILGLFIGVFLVSYHNIWIADWPVLITIFGWIAVIESILYLAFPKVLLSLVKHVSYNEKLWGMISLVLGILFGYWGFVA